jgi:NosR/NirI family nitrous oxide reductase transcriptional regulator
VGVADDIDCDIAALHQRLLGESGYETLRQSLAPDQQAILIAANGAYSFKGSGYVRGGIFDRIALLQGDQSIRFRDRDHVRLGDVITKGAPDFRDVDLFRVPQGTTFDITQPWRLQLLAVRAYGAPDKSFLTFEAGYQLPAAYLKPLPVPSPSATVSFTAAPESTVPPLWQTMWRAKIGQVVVLIAALTLLTGVFFFQDWLAKRPVLYDRLRLGFLTFTLVWIGWYAQAQLSVVNVLAFFDAMRTDFRWQYFLMAPLDFLPLVKKKKLSRAVTLRRGDAFTMTATRGDPIRASLPIAPSTVAGEVFLDGSRGLSVMVIPAFLRRLRR